MIKTTDVTTGEAKGRGFYDELMRTSKSHLQEEYEAGRITGADYSNVYLSVMASNLQTASSFILQYEINNKQLEIAEEQRKNAIKQNELLTAQITQIASQTALTDDELTRLRPLQELQAQHQNTLLQSQNSGQIAQNTLLTSQNIGQLAQNELVAKQEDLLDEQIKSEAVNTVDPTGGIAKANYDKTLAEQAVINQKLITETAQTVGTTATIGGLVGAEMSLKTEQKESFVRDAEQKAAKFYSDVLSIVYSTNPDGADADPALWGIGPSNSHKVLTKLLDGIGVTGVSAPV